MSGRAINWYLQRITGAALLVLLIMHFWVEHFAAEVRTPAGLTFEVIQRRFFQNPWFVAVDISFLFIALYHGLNGIRNICLDYTWGTRFRTPITIVIVLVGIIVAYWGITAFTGNPHLKQNSVVQSQPKVYGNMLAGCAPQGQNTFVATSLPLGE